MKRYFFTFLFTITLVSFTFAGDVHCPLVDPPSPGDDGLVTAPVIVNTNPTVNSTYQFLKGFWEFLSQSSDLF
jgi:hypothetical protein